MSVSQEHLAAVARLVRVVTDRPDLTVRAHHRFVADLLVDSLAMLEILEGIEHDLGVRVADEATSQLVHVGDLVSYLDHHR